MKPHKNFADILAAVRSRPLRTIAVAAAEDASVLGAVRRVADEGVAGALLVGNESDIRAAADEAGVAVDDLPIVAAADEETAAATAVRLVREGRADVLMKGRLPTKTLIHAVLDRDAGLRSGDVLSHIAVTEVPGWPRLLHITDGGVNIDPTPEARLAIVRNAVLVARRFGIERPRVGVLALVEKQDPRLPETIAAAEVVAAAREAIPDAIFEGPIAPDVALSRRAAEKKGIQSAIAGEVDILVGSSITAANHMVKVLVALGGARVGGVIVGARGPIVLLSRSDSRRTKTDSILAALAL